MENNELKIALGLKNSFARRRHEEKLELLQVRDKLTTRIINLRDAVSGKRHKERLEILSQKW